MVFLNPAFLFGLLAASIPVLIHLLNLRKLQKIEFSTLAFLKELQKTKIRRIRLKQWLLLALRVLIIIFLVSSFARPAFETVSLGSGASAAKTTAVFLLDNSFSMSYVNENGSLFNQVKNAAGSIGAMFQEGDEILIIVYSDPESDDQVNFRNIGELENSLERFEISYIRGSLDESLNKAVQLLEESQNINKEIYILSDLQKSSLKEKPESGEYEVLTEQNIKIYIMELDFDKPDNLSVSGAEIKNQIFELNKPVQISAAISNTGESPISNNVASLYMNGVRKAQHSISLSEGETKTYDFETTLETSGLMEIFIELEDDDILQDNRYYNTIFLEEKINILLIGEKRDYTYVAASLGGAANEHFSLSTLPSERLNSVNMDNYQVVIFVAGSVDINAERLRNYIAEGGNLILMPSANSTLPSFNNICAQLRLPEGTGFVNVTNNRNDYFRFEDIDLSHPIFADLFESNKNRNIDSPEIYKYYRIPSSSGGNKIISLIDKSAFLTEYKSGKGKILLYTSAPDLSWSTFPLKGIFAALMNKSVYYLNSASRVNVTFHPGSSMPVNIGSEAVSQLGVVKPDNTREFVTLDSLTGNYLSYNKTEETGVYKFYSGDKLIDYETVNVDAAESDLDYYTASEAGEILSGKIPNGSQTILNTDDNYSEKISQARFGTELWKYFMMIVLLIALVEMLVARNTKKEIADIYNN
jgi:hypothetical protein